MKSQISEMEKNQSVFIYADYDLKGIYAVSEFISDMPSQLSSSDNKSISHLKLFWSQDHVRAKNGEGMEAIKGMITSALMGLDIFHFPTLVQLWMHKAIGSQQFLVTSDLPFGINLLRKGLCLYRKLCLDYKYSLDCEEELGPVGRVFRNGFPEFSPYVSCYSAQEFKLRDAAVSCGVYGYLALPVFESFENQCVCVLELITVWDGNYYLTDVIGKVSEALKAVGLRLPNTCSPFDMQTPSFSPIHQLISSVHNLFSLLYNSLLSMNTLKAEFSTKSALCEIEKGLKAVCDTHNIPFAQTWFTSTAETNIQTSMCTQEKGSYMMFKKLSTFQRDCIQFCLKKGQGVVGTAFTSCTSCFCKDVKQLSIDQYPSVLSARKVGLTGAFAIYLQNKCTGNDVYVLELFLPSNQMSFRKPQTFLNSLLATVKQHFQSFKVACGEESETGIHSHIIKLDKDDRLDSFEICATNQSPPVLRLAQNQLETLHDGRNSITTKHDDIVAVSNKESVLKASEFKPLRNQSEQKLEDIESISHGCLPEHKHLYGKHAINRPSNKRKADHSLFQQDSQGSENYKTKSCQRDQECSVLPPEKCTTPVADPAPPAKESESTIMIKAWYKEDIIKFQLSLLSRIIDFQGEVTKRLKLKAGSFEIKYQSEDNNCISVASDADLQNIMCNAISQKKNTVKFVLKPVQYQIMPVQNESIMTIKTTYKEDTIEFQHSLSLGLLELKEEVMKQLKLQGDGYGIRFLGENNEWIPLASNSDLQNCMTTARSLDQTSVRLSIEPIANQFSEIGANSVSRPAMQATEKQNESLMIKAIYKEDIIKFLLPPSSGMKELNYEVAKRLKLSSESYEIKYQDADNNWIYLSTDADLQKYLSATSLSDSTIRLHLEPIKE